MVPESAAGRAPGLRARSSLVYGVLVLGLAGGLAALAVGAAGQGDGGAGSDSDVRPAQGWGVLEWAVAAGAALALVVGFGVWVHARVRRSGLAPRMTSDQREALRVAAGQKR